MILYSDLVECSAALGMRSSELGLVPLGKVLTSRTMIYSAPFLLQPGAPVATPSFAIKLQAPNDEVPIRTGRGESS